jgi:hypothetical protein
VIEKFKHTGTQEMAAVRAWMEAFTPFTAHHDYIAFRFETTWKVLVRLNIRGFSDQMERRKKTYKVNGGWSEEKDEKFGSKWMDEESALKRGDEKLEVKSGTELRPRVSFDMLSFDAVVDEWMYA